MYHSVQEFWKGRIKDLGKLLGAYFTVGEVREWSRKDSGGSFRDEDPIFLPLSLSIKPELREGLMKMVGGMPLPKEYRKAENEVVVDLGQVTAKEFIEFIEQNRNPNAKPRNPNQNR